MSGFQNSHPLQPDETVQGNLALMHMLQEMLAEIGGFCWGDFATSCRRTW